MSRSSLLPLLTSILIACAPPTTEADSSHSSTPATDASGATNASNVTHASQASNASNATTPAPAPANGLAWASDAEHAELAKIVDPIVRPNVGPARLRSGIPGVGVGVVRDRKLYFFGFGESRAGAPVTRTTVFEIGSITKTFVGLVLADAVLRDRLDLDAPANTLLPPNLQLPSRNGKAITLRHLATHRSGLPSFVPGFGDLPGGLLFMVGHGDASRADLERWLPTVTLASDPGEVGSYSNIGAALLGLALETRAGRPWADLVRDVVTKPLGMTATIATSGAPIPDKATGYDLFARDSDGDGLRAEGAYGPAGALASNVEDMLRYAALHARAVPTSLDAALRFAQKRHGGGIADLPGVEIGLFIGREGADETPAVAEHSGATNAFISDLHAAPEHGVATVILTNRYLMKKDGDATAIPAVDMNKALFTAVRAR